MFWGVQGTPKWLQEGVSGDSGVWEDSGGTQGFGGAPAKEECPEGVRGGGLTAGQGPAQRHQQLPEVIGASHQPPPAPGQQHLSRGRGDCGETWGGNRSLWGPRAWGSQGLEVPDLGFSLATRGS